VRRGVASVVVVVGVLAAVIAVMTFLVRVPVAPTRGYIHLGDVGVYFSAFAFGSLIGFLASGLGTGIADVMGGYVHWAPFSFLIHGAQAVVTAYLARNGHWTGAMLGWVAGTVVMVGGYYLAGGVMYGFGPALTEVPMNLLQATVGGLVGWPLAVAVRRAYPPIQTLARPVHWTERQ
jgi:uncharacterized membrane protein